jgi:UDP-N-acetylmuramoyl-tripeptide--D-alanyl-D-alanine ligase
MAAEVQIGLERVLGATGGVLLRGGPRTFTSVSIDSRAIASGALFFAIKGPRFDGHDFVDVAARAGATGMVVAKGRGAAKLDGDVAVIEVDDPQVALGKLARAHRDAMTSLAVIGVTGSNGKTTTKDMIAAICAAHAGDDAVLKTEGNLNNHLGVPLTLLRLSAAHRYAVVEMGMSALGEIAHLVGLARPDVAVVVNVAGVHLESLGSIENVARAKGEIWGEMGQRGVAIHPVDEPLLAPHLAHVDVKRRRSFGAAAADVSYGDVRSSRDGVSFTLRVGGQSHSVRMRLVGEHNAVNATAAAAAALAAGVGIEAVVRGLERVAPAKHRLQLVPVGDRAVLDDCYNASPLSMRAAIDALERLVPRPQRIAVLGDMLELGPESEKIHAQIGAYAASRVAGLVTLGEAAQAISRAAEATLGGERAVHVDSADDAARAAHAMGGPGAVVLVKASRGMKLERVIDAMMTMRSAG